MNGIIMLGILFIENNQNKAWKSKPFFVYLIYEFKISTNEKNQIT